MNEESKKLQTETSASSVPAEGIQKGQPKFPTWALIGLLVGALIVLKTFIYIKDKKRDGK